MYASRPLSPVATQHSLPSGRYSLLGPDFHRLDRTSLRLAHSFNHLVGAGEEGLRQVEADRFCGFEIDDCFVLVGDCTGRSAGFSPLRFPRFLEHVGFAAGNPTSERNTLNVRSETERHTAWRIYKIYVGRTSSATWNGSSPSMSSTD